MTLTHIWPLWCPRTTSSSTAAAAKMEDEPVTVAVAAGAGAGSSSSRCDCCCLVTKLMRKLKRRRHSGTLRSSSRQGSFQCRYDPLSYSLNFDDGRSGSCGLLDEDYYKFYAFSSRFAANPRASSCHVVPVAAGRSP